MHRPATEFSNEAFFKEVWRLKDFIDSNQIEVRNIAGPQADRRACVRPERPPTVLGEALNALIRSNARPLHNPKKKGAEDRSC
jgi:hypothetical protein